MLYVTYRAPARNLFGKIPNSPGFSRKRSGARRPLTLSSVEQPMHTHLKTRLLALTAVAGLASSALAGGSPENVLLLIDPSNAESMLLGDAYQFTRNIPASNVLYIDPAAVNYATFAGANGNIDAVLGKLANGKLTDHIDYIVIASGKNFYMDAPGLV